MRLGGFRRRTFLAVIAVAAAALGVAATLTLISLRAQWLRAIERSLVAEARLTAVVLAERLESQPQADLDREADRIGVLTRARVTLIAADGRVLGDSTEDAAGIARLDNHATRPEIVEASRRGIGVSQRHSATVGTDLMYAAVRIGHPRVATVRLALPLTDVDDQVAAVARSMALALVVALACALVLGWVSSLVLSRRVDAIAAVARRYAAGDFSVPVPDRGTDELGLVAQALDETSRELGRRLKELARDRERTSAILAGMLEGVLVLDPDGKILLANDAARRLLKADVLAEGQHYLEAVRQPDVGAFVSSSLTGRTPDRLEFSPPGDPGRTIVARAAQVWAAGTRGLVLVLHDVTDLRHADRVRRDFVANVSHELRTPLTAIQGYVEALLDEDLSEPAETRRFVEIIDRQARRMERLVRDLLRLARIEAGQEPTERVPCATAEIFADVVAELDPVLEARRQSVTTKIGPDAARLVTDAGKLHDVLRNLVENAAMYAPSGSRIELLAGRRGGYVDLTVADEGPGIPEADQARIFERFYRVDKARSRESGGTGLGLSIVKHLVGLLGGEVRVANRPAGGAVFTVTLPAGNPPAG